MPPPDLADPMQAAERTSSRALGLVQRLRFDQTLPLEAWRLLQSAAMAASPRWTSVVSCALVLFIGGLFV